jgi:DMSO reductase family type II enzyme heme b subunit
MLLSTLASAQIKTIPVAKGPSENALDPLAPAWKAVPAVALTLQRTPLLYTTDAPAALEISSVQVQMIRVQGGIVARLEWQDKTQNSAKLAKAERSWQGEHLVAQSGATDRFSDACAIMVPSGDLADVSPSLQMGDAKHPVQIYFFDATRGPALMEASGRETTTRTGKTFPANAQYQAGRWAVTLQLPELAPRTPIAVAVWNGEQQDRDGRKYFSVWYKIQ